MSVLEKPLQGVNFTRVNMKKYFDLSNIKLDESGSVEGRSDELRELEDFEIKSVSGGNNLTSWCDGDSPPNGSCNNYTGCSEETNAGGCTNLAYCSDGSNGECFNQVLCNGTTNGPYCGNGMACA